MANSNVNETLLEKLSDPKSIDALNSLLDRVTELHETGVLDSFLQVLQGVNFIKDSLTDTMINKNASMLSNLGEIAAEAASPEVLETIKELKEIHRSGKLRDLFEVTDNIAFLLNSATDKMIERNAAMLGELLNVANEVSDPAMAEALREIKQLQKSGSLKALAEASYMVSFMTDSLDDGMVERIASFGASFIEQVSTPQVQDILKATTNAISETVSNFFKAPPKPGIFNLISMLNNTEVQSGLMFMARLSKNMQKSMIKSYSGK
jgi:uncharacterized protein YjgD (DUF1641 family)